MSQPQGLPAREDLQKLSLRAIVAYASRAARRVQPLVQADQDRITHDAPEVINAAITLAERFVGGVFLVVTEDDILRAAGAADAVGDALKNISGWYDSAARAA